MILNCAFAMTQIRLSVGSTITRGGKVAPGVYRLTSPENLSKPALLVKGNNLVLDFKGVTIEGTPQTAEPDQRRGLGLMVEGANVTIKNLRVRGYKVGIMARGAKNLKIIDSDFSYNWKQRLKSTPEKEDLSDWMSYHQNEKDEWLRYGAAIYLRDCNGFVVQGCRAVGGQCGLMLTSCAGGKVISNNFSFLSGVGVGLYRSSKNKVMHNQIDWCVRGYSHGVYNRGQDSAGILVYEQSSDNVFAYNSVTHGGDGFFLWAGQTTMDTGQGGCNDNLLYGNDFSEAPTNGIEATFSRNKFVNNLVEECWHGLWGGYSYNTLILGNHFAGNEVGIAIEHGQNNSILANQFSDSLAIQLWQNPNQDPSWGYPKHRDTVSHDYPIERNLFMGGKQLASFKDTAAIDFSHNEVVGTPNIATAGKVGLNIQNNVFYSLEIALPGESSGNEWRSPSVQIMTPTWQPYFGTASPVQSMVPPRDKSAMLALQPAPVPKAFMPSGHTGSDMRYPYRYRGKQNIIIGEWGPYDFLSPLLRRRPDLNPAAQKVKANGERLVTYQILGPKGKWRIVSLNGSLPKGIKSSGEAPGKLLVPELNGGDIHLVVEFRGAETTDYRGIVTAAGKPVTIKYDFTPPIAIDWTVKFFKWSKPADPADPHSAPDETALQEAMAGTPLKQTNFTNLDFAGASFLAGIGADHYATVADAKLTVKAKGAAGSGLIEGEYLVKVQTDDGARVFLDDKPILNDAWHYQGPTTYTKSIRLSAGSHALRVEHFQIDGYAQLKVDLVRRRSASTP